MSLKQKPSINNQTNDDQHHLDTGWAWVILVASFMITFLSSGVFSSFGVFLVTWQDQLSGSLTQLQWILSLAIGIPLVIGPVSSAFCNFTSLRNVAMTGALLTGAALFATWFATDIVHLYLCFAVAGIGFGFVFNSSMVIPAYYFDKRLARVYGIVSAGTGIGNFVLPPLFQILIDQLGWQGALLIISGLTVNSFVFAALYRVSPLEIQSRTKLPGSVKRTQAGNTADSTVEPQSNKETTNSSDQMKNDSAEDSIEIKTDSTEQMKTDSTEQTKIDSVDTSKTERTERIKSISPEEEKDCNKQTVTPNVIQQFFAIVLTSFNFQLLSNIRFLLLFLANFPYGLGYVIILSYLPARAVHGGVSEIRAAFLLSIIGIVSLVARFTHGYIIDYKILTASMLTAIAFLLAAISCALFPVSNSYPILVFLTVLVGLSAGVFNVTGPIVAKEYLGVNQVSGAVGLILMSTGAGVFVGLLLTGILFDRTGSYTLAFLLAAASFLVSSVLHFVDPLVKQRFDHDPDEHPTAV